MNVEKKTNMLVMAGLMACLVMVATMFVRVPIPLTRGYVHLGDGMVFISMLILNKKYAVTASAVGASLADIFGGFAIWAPWTLVAKGAMVLIALRIAGAPRKEDGSCIRLRELFGMICGGLVMTAVYYAAEVLMYGNWAVPVVGIPWNIGQFVLGIIIALVFHRAIVATAEGRQLLSRFK